MPLEKSASKAAVGRNIAREEAAGRPKKQSIAIALNTQREAERRKKARRVFNRP